MFLVSKTNRIERSNTEFNVIWGALSDSDRLAKNKSDFPVAYEWCHPPVQTRRWNRSYLDAEPHRKPTQSPGLYENLRKNAPFARIPGQSHVFAGIANLDALARFSAQTFHKSSPSSEPAPPAICIFLPFRAFSCALQSILQQHSACQVQASGHSSDSIALLRKPATILVKQGNTGTCSGEFLIPGRVRRKPRRVRRILAHRVW